MDIKGLLKNAYLIQLKDGFFTVKSLSKLVKRSYSRTFSILKELQRKNYVKILEKRNKGETRYIVDEKGKRQLKVILTAGTYDIIHTGHLKTLEEAKRRGDILIVIVARDKTVEKIKGRRPIIPENQRRTIVQSLKPVDFAILGSEKDFLEPIEKINPDLIVLGRDQPVNKRKLEEELRKRGIGCKVVRLRVWDSSPLAKTSKIIKKINEIFHISNI
ncbi:MAG: adenylyltransferase/cytidyltransferase family protein [Candidatus Baldrarchaeia archaeon]